ncbi:MAG: M1 family metallopeptidase [Acidobacteriota bacterium]
MKKYVLVAFAIFLTATQIGAQTLYMPRTVKRAFDAGTRSADGRPGKNYWQNHAVYNISIKAAPPARTVRGTEEITYTNNSPNALDNIVFRLTLNSHTSTAPRERPISAEYLSDGVQIDEYTENGKAKPWTQENNSTFQAVKLDQKLAPQASVKITFKWHVDLSVESSREGAIDPTTFFVAYFYPRVAVYDDIDGWDTFPFLEGHEFYNDFNDYTFQVTVPKNFIVWATGDLLNAGETLQPKYAERLKSSFTSDSIINVATAEDLAAKTLTAQTDTVTWKWKADNVTDVAMAFSDHYLWDAGSVVVDKAAGRRASVQAAYNIEAKDYTHMVEYAKHTLDWSSNNYPGVPYPFQKTTIVRGFADMEYPMMANDSTFTDPNFARFVAEHEILHSWFPFYMGINEQRYGFMDEGWATAFENLIGAADMGQERADAVFKQFRVSGWALHPGTDADIPIITPGDAMTGRGFGDNEYGKAALGYLAIKDLLGDDLFKKALHTFMDRWHGKHPLPWDMFNSFNAGSGRNLNWFFNNWYFSNGYIDLGVESVTQNGSDVTLKIKNTGGFAAPVNVIVKYADGTTQTLHQTPEIWERDQRNATVTFKAAQTIASVQLEGGIWMDANEADNKWEAK